jgi:hypothetical protein
MLMIGVEANVAFGQAVLQRSIGLRWLSGSGAASFHRRGRHRNDRRFPLAQ